MEYINFIYFIAILLLVLGIEWFHFEQMKSKDELMFEERKRFDEILVKMQTDYANRAMSEDAGEFAMNFPSYPEGTDKPEEIEDDENPKDDEMDSYVDDDLGPDAILQQKENVEEK